MIDSFKNHFKRGGDFYHSLHQTSSCIDWCLQYQLSDPFDTDLSKICTCHVHEKRDPMVIKKNNFFSSLIKDAYIKVSKAKIIVNVDILGKGRVLRLSHGNIVIKLEQSGVVKRIPWIEFRDQLTDTDFNTLCLVQYIQRAKDRHSRYMRHLYLDRNQSYGERIIGQESTWCGYMDYMMKLRAKSWMSDSSTFHMLMNKGSSVHVFCIKRRIMNEADATNIGVQCGDYQMVWIDSFGSNTTQGGYETLSVIEASLIEAKKIFNNKLESISLFSDAGSGYKTIQCLLGIRNISNAHGVQIKR